MNQKDSHSDENEKFDGEYDISKLMRRKDFFNRNYWIIFSGVLGLIVGVFFLPYHRTPQTEVETAEIPEAIEEEETVIAEASEPTESRVKQRIRSIKKKLRGKKRSGLLVNQNVSPIFASEFFDHLLIWSINFPSISYIFI